MYAVYVLPSTYQATCTVMSRTYILYKNDVGMYYVDCRYMYLLSTYYIHYYIVRITWIVQVHNYYVHCTLYVCTYVLTMYLFDWRVLRIHYSYIWPQIDHFSFANNATFKLRYLINESYWDRDNGPIFFYTGNEGDIEMFAQNTVNNRRNTRNKILVPT